MLSNKVVRSFSVVFIFVSMLVFLGGCSDGISGTGVVPKLTGIAAIGSPIAGATVTLKDGNGDTDTTTTNDEGSYSFDVSGKPGPFFVNVDTPDNKRLYCMADKKSDSSYKANLHPLSDLATRNWFSSRGRNVETEFDDSVAIQDPPTYSSMNALVAAIKRLILKSFPVFQIDESSTEFDFVSSDFETNHTRFDLLLDNLDVTYDDNKIKVRLNHPSLGFTAYVLFDFDMGEDLGQQDNIAPSEPGNLLLIPANQNQIALLWNSAFDNVGVAGYNIYRSLTPDGAASLIASSQFPSYIDSGLNAATQYCYSLEAVDGADNVSERTEPVCVTTPDVPNIDPPSQPSNLILTPLSSSAIALSWTPSPEADVMGYDVLRGVSGGPYAKVATTVASSHDDLRLLAGTEYCYKLQAFDAALNRTDTDAFTEVCATTQAANVDTQKPNSTATPVGGSYVGAQSVQLDCTDDSGTCTIHYTVNGDTPTTASPIYSQAINVDVDATIKYFAIDPAGNVEDWNVALYEIIPLTSQASVSGGIYNAVQTVALSCPGAASCTIYYTDNDTTPTTGSAVYQSALSVDTNTVLQFFAVLGQATEQAVNREDYVIDLNAPDTTASVPGRTYTSAQTVSLDCVDDNSGCGPIYYAIDSVPTTNSDQYTGPILIDTTSTLQFFAIDNAGNAETIKSETYTINIPDLVLDVTTAAQPVASNGRILHSITVSNRSQLPMDGVEVTYVVPADVQFYYITHAEPNPSAASCPAGDGWCRSGETATWLIGTLDPGESRNIDLSVEVLAQLGGTEITGQFSATNSILTTPVTVSKSVTVNNSPNANISMSVSKDPVIAGDIFTLSLDVGNIAAGPLNLGLLAILPNGLSVVSISDDGTVGASPNEVNWPVDNLAVGESVHHEITVMANGNLSSGEILKMRAGAISIGNGLPVAVESEQAVTVVDSSPVEVDVSVVRDSVASDGRLLYQLNVSNTSQLPVNGVSVLMRVPAGVEFYYIRDAEPTPSAARCPAGDGFCRAHEEAYWNIGTLASGESRLIEINALVLPGLSGTLFSAPVRVELDELADTISLMKTVRLYNEPVLQMALSASTDAVVAGQTVTYRVDVSNTEVTGVNSGALQLELPDGVSVQSISDGGVEEASGVVRWTLNGLTIGSSMFREVVVAVNTPINRGSILPANAQLLSPASSFWVVNKSELALTVVDAQPLAFDISAGPDAVASGNRLFYQITVSNVSALPVTGVSVQMRIPEDIQFHYITHAEPSPSAATCPAGDGWCRVNEEAYWNLGTLEAGASEVIQVDAEVLPLLDGHLISAPIRIEADQLPDTVNVFKTIRVDNDAIPQMALSTSADAVSVGETFTLYADIGNTEVTSISSVDITLELPAGLTVSDTSDGGVQDAEGNIVWSATNLGVGQSVRRQVSVSADAAVAGQILKARLVISSISNAAMIARVEQSLTVADSMPLSLDISALPDAVSTGDRLMYQLTVSNTSQLPVNGVSVQMRMPVGLQFYYITDAEPNPSPASCPAGDGWCRAHEEADWNLGGLAAGASRIIVVNAEVLPTLLNGSLISAPVRLSYTDREDEVVVQKTVRVNINPAVEMVVSASDDAVVAGAPFDVHVDLGNIGNSVLSGGELRLGLPAELSITAGTISNGGAVDAATGEVVWGLADLPVTSSLNRQVNVSFASGVAPGTLLKLRAELTHNNDQSVDISAEHAVTVAGNPPLSLSVSTDGATSVSPGGTVIYTFTVTNDSPLPVAGASLRLRIPEGMQFHYLTDATVAPFECRNGDGFCTGGEEARWDIGGLGAGVPWEVVVNASVLATNPVGHLLDATLRLDATDLDDTIYIHKVLPVQ